MLLRFDTGATLEKIDAQRLHQKIYAWSATERWWCGAPHVLIEHGAHSRLHGTLEATFGDEPLDLAMGNLDAQRFCAFLATTGVDWTLAVEGPRSREVMADPDAVFAANPTRYGGQIAGPSSRGLGAAAHYRRWLLATITLDPEPLAALPPREDGEVRAGAWRWQSALAVTPVHLADRASLALGLGPIGASWDARDRLTVTEQLRGVLASQQAYGSSAMPLEHAGPAAEQWVNATDDDAAWLVNGNTTQSWQPLGDLTFETGFVRATRDRVAMIYVGDED